jgi:hypothetical protein
MNFLGTLFMRAEDITGLGGGGCYAHGRNGAKKRPKTGR